MTFMHNAVDLVALRHTRIALARKHGRIANLSQIDCTAAPLNHRCPASSSPSSRESVLCCCGQRVAIVNGQIPEHDLTEAGVVNGCRA